MEVGVDAVPAGLLHRTTPRGKGRAALLGPDIAARVGGEKRLIFTPSVIFTHKKSLPSFCVFLTRGYHTKERSDRFLLKRCNFMLNVVYFLINNAWQMIMPLNQTIIRTLKTPPTTSYTNSPPHCFTKS